MKKLLLLFLLCNSIAHSQWTFKTIDNGFDDPYRICYTKENDGAMLKLENVNNNVVFYIQGNYTCEEAVIIDLSFLVNGEYNKYTFEGVASQDREVIFFTWDLMGSLAAEDFKDCSTLKVRVNDTVCGESIYTFNMSGSTLALKYIQKIP